MCFVIQNRVIIHFLGCLTRPLHARLIVWWLPIFGHLVSLVCWSLSYVPKIKSTSQKLDYVKYEEKKAKP